MVIVLLGELYVDLLSSMRFISNNSHSSLCGSCET